MFKIAGSCPCSGAPSTSTGAGNARRSCGVSPGATGGTTSGGGVSGCQRQAQRLICPGLCLKIGILLYGTVCLMVKFQICFKFRSLV
jgi:hypothetical protein